MGDDRDTDIAAGWFRTLTLGFSLDVNQEALTLIQASCLFRLLTFQKRG